MALLIATCACHSRWITFDRADTDDTTRRAAWCPDCEADALARFPGIRQPSFLHGWHRLTR